MKQSLIIKRHRITNINGAIRRHQWVLIDLVYMVVMVSLEPLQELQEVARWLACPLKECS